MGTRDYYYRAIRATSTSPIIVSNIHERKPPDRNTIARSISTPEIAWERTINNLNKLMSFLPSSSLLVDHITRYARYPAKKSESI